MNVDVTGIRFQFSGTKEEQTAQTEAFLRGLHYPQQVTLKAEPDNPFDAEAIAVYLDYRRIGYIKDPSNKDVLPLLNPCCGTLEATLTGHDGHVTGRCFIDDKGLGTPLPTLLAERQLPASPIDRKDALPIAPEENGWELLGSQLLTRNYENDEVEQMLDDMSRYLDYPTPSLCMTDLQTISLIDDKAQMYLGTTCISDTPARRERLEALHQRLNEQIGDFHTVEGCGQLLTAHMDHLRRLAAEPGSLFEHFELHRLGQRLNDDPKSKNPINLVTKEVLRLQDWLNDIDRDLFNRDDWDMEAIATTLKYKHLTRRELYDVESVMLLITHLRPFANPIHRLSLADLDNLAGIFCGDIDKAKAFIKEVHVMTDVEIVERVAKGIKNKEIINSLSHRPLWTILNKSGLYKRSETNWNDQLTKKDFSTYNK